MVRSRTIERAAWTAALLLLLPPMVIADLGAGEGAFSLLLAQRAQQVIADRMAEAVIDATEGNPDSTFGAVVRAFPDLDRTSINSRGMHLGH